MAAMKEEEAAMKKAMLGIFLMIARIKYLPEGLEDKYETMSKDSIQTQKQIHEKGHAGVNTAGDTDNLKELQKKKEQTKQ